MKFFLDPNSGAVYAYEDDGSQDSFVRAGLQSITAEQAAEVMAPPPSDERTIADFTAAIQSRLDSFAKTRNYDGILSACSYQGSGVLQFLREATYCVQKRDETWSVAYQILGDYRAGHRPMPTLSEVEAELPELTWP